MPKQIVLTGMHRSGTSLAASLARRAGIDMGSDLVPAKKGNPRGYFEDLDFRGLQEAILARQGLSPFFLPSEGLAEPDAEAEAAAKALIERRSGKSLWGWKDPRTCLFLDFWHGLLPDPYYVFLYRHPVEVALSLLRRRQGWLDPLSGIRAWTVYNTRILDFYHSHPDRCLLWNICGLTRSFGSAFGALAGRLGVDLRLEGLQDLFHPDELRLGLSLSELDWRVVIPGALDLYGRLEDAADIPAGPPAFAAETQFSKGSGRGSEVRERELTQVSEHLLYLLLKREDERPGAAAEGEGIRRLAGQLQRLKVSLSEIERSRAIKLVRFYWRVAAKLRALGRRSFPETAGRRTHSVSPSPGPGSGIDPARCLVGCVAENNPKYLEQACRLVQSIRWFGGGLASSKIMVCVVEGVDPAFRERLTRYGADVRIVPRFLAANPFANKLQFFGEASSESCETILLLDCDTLVVQDPLPWIRSGSFQAKIADRPTVTHAVFKRVFQHYGLALPERRYTTTFGGTPTIRYCNSGVLAVPVPLANPFITAWRDFNARLSADQSVLSPCEKHCDQASLSLALAAHPIPFGELPLPLNYPLHLTHLPAPPGFTTIDPIILHYHGRVDSRGNLMKSPYPPAQARIALFNRRKKEADAKER
jgi:hypothetical protein